MEKEHSKGEAVNGRARRACAPFQLRREEEADWRGSLDRNHREAEMVHVRPNLMNPALALAPLGLDFLSGSLTPVAAATVDNDLDVAVAKFACQLW